MIGLGYSLYVSFIISSFSVSLGEAEGALNSPRPSTPASAGKKTAIYKSRHDFQEVIVFPILG